MAEESPCCKCCKCRKCCKLCESDPHHPTPHTLECPTYDHDLRVAVKTLREAVFALRRAFEGSWNLRDPHDPEVSYSVDKWLEMRADRLDGVDSGRGL